MGQRSQIYVRYNKKLIIANYYQWNFGERMISRARYGLEYIKDQLDEGYLWYFRRDNDSIEKLRRYFDINFDYKDIVMSTNLKEEWEREKEDFTNWTLNDWVFGADNNDGHLFIDINYNEETKEYSLKYCFTKCENESPLTPTEYMDWDYPDYKTSEYLSEKSKKSTEENLEYITSNYTLMTQEELKDFLNTKYSLEETSDC